MAESAVTTLQTRILDLEANVRLPLVKADATATAAAAAGQSNDDLLRQCASERELLRSQSKKDAAEIADLSVCRWKVTSAEQEVSMLKLQGETDAQMITSLQGRLAEMEKKLLQDKEAALAGERELATVRAAGNTVAVLEDKLVTLARALSRLSDEKEAEIGNLQKLLEECSKARSGVLDVPMDVCGSGRCPQVSAGRSTSEPGNGEGKLEIHVVPGEDPEVAALQQRIDELEALIADAKTATDQEIAMLKAQARKDADDLANYKSRLAELQAQVTQGANECAGLAKQLEAMTAAKSAIDRELAMLKLHDQKSAEELKRISALEGELVDLSLAKAGLLKQVAMLTTTKKEADQELDSLRKQTASDAMELSRLKQRLGELTENTKQFNALMAANLTHEKEMATVQASQEMELAILRSKLSESEKLLRNSYDEMADLSARLNGVTANARVNGECSERNKALEATIARLRAEMADLELAKQRDAKEIDMLLERIKKSEGERSELQNVLSRTLGDSTMNVVTKQQNADLKASALKAAEMTKLLEAQAKEDAATIARMKKSLADAQAQLRTANADLALIAKQLVEVHGVMTKADQQIGELKTQSKDVNDMATCNRLLGELQAKAKTDADELIALRLQMLDVATANEALKAQIQGLKELVAENANEIHQLKPLRSQLQELTTARTGPITAQEAPGVKNTTAIDELKQRLLDAQLAHAEAEALRKELAAAQSHVDELDGMLRKSYDELSDITGRLNELTDSKTQLSKDGDALKSQSARDRARIAELEAMVIGSNNDYIAAMNKLHEQTASAATAQAAAENSIADMENRNRQYQDEVASLGTQLKTAQAVSNARIAELEGKLTLSP